MQVLGRWQSCNQTRVCPWQDVPTLIWKCSSCFRREMPYQNKATKRTKGATRVTFHFPIKETSLSHENNPRRMACEFDSIWIVKWSRCCCMIFAYYTPIDHIAVCKIMQEMKLNLELWCRLDQSRMVTKSDGAMGYPSSDSCPNLSLLAQHRWNSGSLRGKQWEIGIRLNLLAHL